MGFDNLLTVFGCSIETDSLSKMFDFSTVFSSWVIAFSCFIGFNDLEKVAGVESSFFLWSFWYLVNFYAFVFWRLFMAFFSFTRVRCVLVNLVASKTKSLFLLFQRITAIQFDKVYSLMIIFKHKFSKIFHSQFCKKFSLLKMYIIVISKKKINFYSLWKIKTIKNLYTIITKCFWLYSITEIIIIKLICKRTFLSHI